MEYRDLERASRRAREKFQLSKVELLQAHFEYIPAAEVVGFYLMLDYGEEVAFDLLAPGSMEDNIENMGGFESVIMKLNRGYTEEDPGLWFETESEIFSLTDETFLEKFVNLRDLAYRMVIHYEQHHDKTYDDAVDEILSSNNPPYPLA